ncbi:hydroxymethylglutaryl-CoA lyase [Halalkalibacter krulwichiae]|uniref:Hydroxymethylglutaryl-CoA lyase YngG n=1 Tax=Halalkalibacter krulwichiae TaxID=199441 RepID=A0A1X9MFB6_9BACI|nr:hydroxymethylglutaryl-CoA lyase [Halalkalibacter krulwichiae]ARK29142.1 Hydroxymethylglutaryl-CoA lyase YngG [Halalkalibacter krulwichiae]
MNEKKVKIREVGPRDGLQNERQWIETEDKINWINQLAETGLSYIELTSFVHPKWIPALADANEVVKGVKRNKSVSFGALVPNERGLERALQVGIDEVAVFLSASETHNRKNINKSIKETINILKPVVYQAKLADKSVRGYISTVFGCPYEGNVNVQRVIAIAQSLLELGVDEVSLGDTTGIATPNQVEAVLQELARKISLETIALHPHDTRGTALANVFAAYRLGVRTFDGATAGLGGCPYAPGASGNVATEDLVYLLEGLGAQTGIHLERLVNCGKWIQNKLKRNLPSHHLQIALASENKEGFHQ